MKIEASVLDSEMGILDGVTVQEIGVTGFPERTTTTDVSGKFTLDVTSSKSVIRLSKVGFITLEVAAEDFGSYQELAFAGEALDNVNVTNPHQKKSDNSALIIGLLAVVVIGAVIYSASTTTKKPTPKTVKV